MIALWVSVLLKAMIGSIFQTNNNEVIIGMRIDRALFDQLLQMYLKYSTRDQLFARCIYLKKYSFFPLNRYKFIMSQKMSKIYFKNGRITLRDENLEEEQAIRHTIYFSMNSYLIKCTLIDDEWRRIRVLCPNST